MIYVVGRLQLAFNISYGSLKDTILCFLFLSVVEPRPLCEPVLLVDEALDEHLTVAVC